MELLWVSRLPHPEVADAFKGPHISTFGGNPVTAAAVLATIEVIEKKNLVRNARRWVII